MTSYIRFAHLEAHHLSMVTVEALVTVGTCVAFGIMPSRWCAFFPNQAFRRFALRRIQSCVFIFLLSFFGRIALLPIEPFPPVRVQDEFSYLLASETFAHGRLTNPTPPLWHHFEAFHVLLQPTYMSKYGAAPALFMAFGQRILGTPRAGVMVSMALAVASLCWMLQAYVPAEWALLGGLIAVFRISWFSYFGNGYWGGSVALLGGCLLLGAAARLCRLPRPRDGILLAVGLILLANSRPCEGGLLALPVCVIVGSILLWQKRASLRVLAPGLILLLLGGVCTAYYCERVTGRLMFPWVVHWERWGMCPPFLFEKPNYTVHYQFPEQLSYNRDGDMFMYTQVQSAVDFFAEVIAKGIYQWLFFIFPALTLPLIGIIPTVRSKRFRIVVAPLAIACLGFAWETYLQAHYFAVAAGGLYLMMVNGFRWMRVRARDHVVWLKLLRGCLASVALMVMMRMVIVPIDGFPTWGTWVNLTGQTPGFEAIHQFLARRHGGQLVIVRYGPQHSWLNDWIYNGYDLPSQHVIWARDTEPEESNLPLFCAFPDREAWLLIPPEEGFVPPPDRTARWRIHDAEQLLEPYPHPRDLDCSMLLNPAYSEKAGSAASPSPAQDSGSRH